MVTRLYEIEYKVLDGERGSQGFGAGEAGEAGEKYKWIEESWSY